MKGINDKVVHKGKFQGHYIYRSISFLKSDRIPNGYWGAYSIGRNNYFDCRADVLKHIDNIVTR